MCGTCVHGEKECHECEWMDPERPSYKIVPVIDDSVVVPAMSRFTMRTGRRYKCRVCHVIFIARAQPGIVFEPVRRA